jgi:hypothetical protein
MTSSIQNHLITLSARASTLGGIVRPISLAAFRFWLLRLGHSPSHHEHESDYRKPQPFWILDPSAWLRACPEFIEATGFGF